MELRSLANGVPFLYSDFKFNLNTKNKVFPIPVSVCCPLNLFNLSIDAFNGTVGKCTVEYFRKLESDKNNNGIADHREGSSAQYISKSTSFIVKIAGDNKEVISTSHKDGKTVSIYSDRSNA